MAGHCHTHAHPQQGSRPQWEAGLSPDLGGNFWVPLLPWFWGSAAPPLSAATEACCELCGLYFENRKALASHARAHLRQFGVTEWCVNGSPIETLSEWIKHRPQKVGAYRSYIQGGRPFTKKFRNAGHGREGDKRLHLGLAPGGLSMVGRSAGGEPGPEAGRAADSGERPLAASPPGTVKAEEHQRQNINSECWGQRVMRAMDTSRVHPLFPQVFCCASVLESLPHLLTHSFIHPPSHLSPGPGSIQAPAARLTGPHSNRPSLAEGGTSPRSSPSSLFPIPLLPLFRI